MTSYGGAPAANLLLPQLLAGEDVTLPDIDFTGPEYQIPGGALSDMYAEIPRLTNADLVSRDVGGSGTFDAIMDGISAYLKREFTENRITGAEYTKAFIALTQSAIDNAVQFLVNRDKTYWESVAGQIAAINARVELETNKVKYAGILLQAMTTRAQYATAKMGLSIQDVQFGQETYKLEQLLPIEKTKLSKQNDQLDLQNAGQTIQNDSATFTLTYILPANKSLILEKVETERSQTLDIRTDGAAVKGTVGKQKDLYTQQISSYQRDAEVKAAKIFTDAWTVQKTVDEGLSPPTAFANANLDQILATLKTKNAL